MTGSKTTGANKLAATERAVAAMTDVSAANRAKADPIEPIEPIERKATGMRASAAGVDEDAGVGADVVVAANEIVIKATERTGTTIKAIADGEDRTSAHIRIAIAKIARTIGGTLKLPSSMSRKR
jgi:hypothetical protein